MSGEGSEKETQEQVSQPPDRPITLSGRPLLARFIITAITLIMAAVILIAAGQWFLGLLMAFFLVFILAFTFFYARAKKG